MKKRLKKFILPLTIVSMLLSGCGKKAEETIEEINQTPVEVQQMSVSSIKKELVYAGQVKPNDTVNVTSKLSGLVESVKYDVGDYVNEGDILFTLDKKDIQDQIKQLEASLKVSDASVASARTGLSQVSDGGQIASSRLSLQSGVENAQNAVENTQKAVENAQKSVDNSKIQLENMKATLEDTEKKYNDTKKLYDAGIVARADFESVELAYNQSKNAYEQAQLTYEQTQLAYEQAQLAHEQAIEACNNAQQSLDIFDNKTTSDNIAAAQDGVNTALASREAVATQLAIARSTLNDTSVKAPISGYISAKNISETNMVSAQSAPYTIVDMSKVTVEVNVSEKIINLISLGESVDVVIPTIGSETITGVIKTISPSANSTNIYPVVIEIENADSRIKSGMFAEIHFIESRSDSAYVVPRNTVLENDTDKYVFVVEDNKAVKRVVETGIDNGENIQILRGVNNGDNVIVNGQDYVIDGDEVRVINGEGDNKNNENAENAAQPNKASAPAKEE